MLSADIAVVVSELVTILSLSAANWTLTGSLAHRIRWAKVAIGADVDVQAGDARAYHGTNRVRASARVGPHPFSLRPSACTVC